MLTFLNPFENETGSSKLSLPKYYILLFVVCLASAWVIGNLGVVGGLGLIMLPFFAVYLILLFQKPVIGIYTAVGLGFIILGATRYVDIPMVGISLDSIMILTFLVLIFKNFYTKLDWTPAKKDITVLAGIWLVYGVLSIANPEIRNRTVWIASFRSVCLYMFLVVILTLLVINSKKKIYYFFYTWGVFSILASLKGIMQATIGVDHWEKVWLDNGGYVTHILFGKLRVFSFICDAGQFGATQAYAGVVFIILSFVQKDRRKKIFFLLVGLLGIYGMFLSGTRGAISVPISGFMLYFVLRKNKGVMISGFALLAVVFIFFKYTNVGQGNQQIRRMRTAFDPNDASLQLRLENQRKLSVYLSSRPLGGGLGHAGSKAMKVLPNTFLSSIATDSWYVMIWAELGIVGLAIHLIILFYIIIRASFLIMFRIRDPILKIEMTALASGMLGIMVASYGNAVLGQVPTSLLLYTSMAIMLNAERYDSDDLHINTVKEEVPISGTSKLV
jgi:hypothetical protein